MVYSNRGAAVNDDRMRQVRERGAEAAERVSSCTVARAGYSPANR